MIMKMTLLVSLILSPPQQKNKIDRRIHQHRRVATMSDLSLSINYNKKLKSEMHKRYDHYQASNYLQLIASQH